MSPTVTSKSTTAPSPHSDPKHPHSVPILAAENEGEEAPDQPFAEGAQDTVELDLRHRMILPPLRRTGVCRWLRSRRLATGGNRRQSRTTQSGKAHRSSRRGLTGWSA
jgi:hypothetical protein